LGASIATGMNFLEAQAHADAVLLMTCDQPLVTPRLLDRMVFSFKRFGTPIDAAHYDEAVGVPALFSRPYFFELAALSRDEGAM
jgi:molybdenum cofactor cytidylyltransferase